jgi:hypothetical protein
MTSDWIVIVEPMPRLEAERALADWLEEQAAKGNSFRKDEIRQDLMLSKDREHLVRYAVQVKGT